MPDGRGGRENSPSLSLFRWQFALLSSIGCVERSTVAFRLSHASLHSARAATYDELPPGLYADKQAAVVVRIDAPPRNRGSSPRQRRSNEQWPYSSRPRPSGGGWVKKLSAQTLTMCHETEICSDAAKELHTLTVVFLRPA